MNGLRGTTLVELLIVLAVLAVAMILGFSFLVVSQRYYAEGSAAVDFQNMAQVAVTKLVEDTQETDPKGLYVNVQHNAVVFVSARDTGGTFRFDGTVGSPTFGKPIWQKWTCYYLAPQPGTPYFNLIRKEGNPTGSSFPSTTIPSPIPTEADFQDANIRQKILAQNVQIFDIEDDDCDSTDLESPLEIQLVLNGSMLGLSNALNPGVLNPFVACRKTGYWIPIILHN